MKKKFRAWDKRAKVMIPWGAMTQTAFNDGKTNLLYDIMCGHRLDVELMQFTGLKDKNGKEIYEGDIVKYTNKENHHTEFLQMYVIEFGEQDLGHCTYQQTIGWNATPIHQFNKPRTMDSKRLSKGILDIFGSHKVFVIGNIYENEDLLI